MAYGVAGIGTVEAWTAASYAADDGSLDFDNTTCMLNGTNAESCDEIKEGIINLRVEITHAPASILTLSIRFYLNDIMTAGDNAVLPYTDANSVSTTNEDVESYSSSGQWISHVLSAALIAELFDDNGSCYVRLSSSDATAKSKIGEVNIDIAIQTYELAGITRDVDEAVLVSCEYNIWKITRLESD